MDHIGIDVHKKESREFPFGAATSTDSAGPGSAPPQ